jgi:hypothetical protein
MEKEKNDSACCVCLEPTERRGGKPLYSSGCCGCWLHLECAYSIARSSTCSKKCPLCRAKITLPDVPSVVEKRRFEHAHYDHGARPTRDMMAQRRRVEIVGQRHTLRTSNDAVDPGSPSQLFPAPDLRVPSPNAFLHRFPPFTSNRSATTHFDQAPNPSAPHTEHPEAPPWLSSPPFFRAVYSPSVAPPVVTEQTNDAEASNGRGPGGRRAERRPSLTLDDLLSRPVDSQRYFSARPDTRFSHEGPQDVGPPAFLTAAPSVPTATTAAQPREGNAGRTENSAHPCPYVQANALNPFGSRFPSGGTLPLFGIAPEMESDHYPRPFSPGIFPYGYNPVPGATSSVVGHRVPTAATAAPAVGFPASVTTDAARTSGTFLAPSYPYLHPPQLGPPYLSGASSLLRNPGWSTAAETEETDQELWWFERLARTGGPADEARRNAFAAYRRRRQEHRPQLLQEPGEGDPQDIPFGDIGGIWFD